MGHGHLGGRYASTRDPRVACVVADSAFASLEALAQDLVGKVSKRIPALLVRQALGMIKDSVRYRCSFDIRECDAMRALPACTTPAMFIAAADDDFILPRHSATMHAALGAPDAMKRLEVVPGKHNTTRPLGLFTKVPVERRIACHRRISHLVTTE